MTSEGTRVLVFTVFSQLVSKSLWIKAPWVQLFGQVTFWGIHLLGTTTIASRTSKTLTSLVNFPLQTTFGKVGKCNSKNQWHPATATCTFCSVFNLRVSGCGDDASGCRTWCLPLIRWFVRVFLHYITSWEWRLAIYFSSDGGYA